MTLLAVERIKLFSTRSPWWSMFLALAMTIGFGGLMAIDTGPGGTMTIGQALVGHRFGLIVVMVMATLAVTTEYRFGTIRATFQAVPNRMSALLAKTTIVTVLALAIGEIAAFGSWGVAQLLAPQADLAISTAAEWRRVAGIGLEFAGGAVIAVAAGLLIRQSAGAITLITIWVLLVENLVGLIPRVGREIQSWMPFHSIDRFLSGTTGDTAMGPWASLGYFAAFAVALLILSLVTAQRRDA